jgi:branched-chain amino acid transport system ATP-binding protein
VPLLEVTDVGVRFGGVVALAGLSFEVAEGQMCALIGPNGAGKTTLFNVVSRLYTPTEGAVRFDGRDLLALPPHRIASAGIARTFQNLALVSGLSVLDNVCVGAYSRSRGGFLSGATLLPSLRHEREVRARGLAGCARRPAVCRSALRDSQTHRDRAGADEPTTAADARRACERADPRRSG